MAGMITVMIKCPVTGKEVNTNIVMNEMVFNAQEFAGYQVECPHCGQTHQWEKKDTYPKKT